MVIATSKNRNGNKLTREDITELAQDAFDTQRKKIEIATIQREVEKRYGLSHDDMIGSKRTKNINFPRQIAMYLSRELTDEVFASIGKKFGGRDHTTIMNGVGNIEKKMKEDRTFYDDIEQLKVIIRERS
ncbi:MAG: helix-turn-helix domain-containing protein [Coriobacteriia bacterium]|nr:helix-turn-helix domain-containing protein [Coriobacteriia bacterium]